MARTRTVVHPAPQEQQVPTGSPRPTRHFLRYSIIGILVIAVVAGALALAMDLFSSKSAPAAQPERQTETGTGVGEIIPPADENPPIQETQPQPVVTTPVIIDYHGGVWTEIGEGFNPSTIPVEEGIYDGEYSWSITKGPYGRWILQLEGVGVAVAAARDETDKNIVFLSLDADRYGPYVLLSVDGEKSLCRLNLLPVTWEGQKTGGVAPGGTRVKAQGQEIHLYGRYGPNRWWKMVVQKNELPCS